MIILKIVAFIEALIVLIFVEKQNHFLNYVYMRIGSKRLVAVGLFTIVLTILINLSWWLFYNNTQRLLDDQLSRRLASIARTTHSRITPLQVSRLVNDDLSSYYEIIEILEQVRSIDSLSELFILNSEARYLATTSMDNDSLYVLRELNRNYIDSLLFSEESNPLVTPAHQTGEFYLKTAFIPLVDTGYFTAAILGVEASVDYSAVLSDLRQNLNYSTGLSLVLGLLFGVIFLFYQRQVSRVEGRLYLNETHAFLGRMVAVVSHEIKNPLMIIRAAAERLKKQNESDESRYVIEEVDRLNQIVTGYLDFAKTGGDRKSYLNHESPEAINLDTLFKNLHQHLSEKYQNQKIIWISKSSPLQINLISYPRALRQILLNLLINGCEACLTANRPISVGLEAENLGKMVRISVIDNGQGMSKREMDKIGTPFYTTRQNGSGLGFYLCRELVDEMNGKFNINSTPGKGTTITLELLQEIEK
ncbi:sensor histidine kinase [Candidatus Zixiibacteriota bacterium]